VETVLKKISTSEIDTPSVDLLTAIDKGNVSIIRQHIGAGTNINDYPIPNGEPFEGVEPLIQTVLKDNSEIVQLLLDNGADIEIKAKNKDGGRPIHWAVFFQQEEMVSLLIKSGTNVNSLDTNGLTSVDTASYVKLTVMKDAEKLKINQKINEILIENGGKSASDL
jgi:ankyrin repeat protein